MKLIESASQPERIFNVSGTESSRRTVRSMRRCASRRISSAPPPRFDLRDRAAAVDVDDVDTGRLHDRRCLGHAVEVGAESGSRSVARRDQRIARWLFRSRREAPDERRELLITSPTAAGLHRARDGERHVRHSGHGRQHERLMSRSRSSWQDRMRRAHTPLERRSV
jgi:hypothetical protein